MAYLATKCEKDKSSEEIARLICVKTCKMLFINRVDTRLQDDGLTVDLLFKNYVSHGQLTHF